MPDLHGPPEEFSPDHLRTLVLLVMPSLVAPKRRQAMPVVQAYVNQRPKASIIPVYGCQKGKTIVESSIPPRPSAPLSVTARSPRRGNTHPDSESSSLPRPLRHRRLESLGTRAHADFLAIRQLHPPSPTAWIAEASEYFDPSVRSRDDVLRHDIQIFVYQVLIPQGEYCPGIYDFRMSWLQYYEARVWGISPPRSALQHYDEFLQSWGLHFYEAWDRAGRPNNQASSFVEAVSEESQVHGTRHGRTSSVSESVSSSLEFVVSPVEVELEVDVEMVYATESRRMVSGERRSDRKNRRASRRSRPY